ncbi:zinc dependent phospholipase C family protein [Lunatimonas salinarum]|uniref:zinc dependent phospholipase C family protein n=1 Tax=Lunatimonas salinarum TaxID=1774590 RepID=UPI001FD73880|nr:zinc dependent phospholipase C family protein [Lunatimonas salinarum]
MKVLVLSMALWSASLSAIPPWGFYAHRLINRQAVFSLPPEMIRFYKYHLTYITENAVNPDRRRYAVKGEAEKHFLDADVYGDSAVYRLPRYWQQAVEQYSEDTLRAHGIAPWSTYHTFLQLIRAFELVDTKSILRISSDLGHYVGDIHVPLHTTKNYNGQLTGQYGIHGFWESRIPELLADDYEFWVGKATYLEQPQIAIWDALIRTHEAVDSVLQFEKSLSASFPENRKYSYEERGGINTRVYSKDFTHAYHRLLNGQVERQMRQAMKMIADLWFTAWVLAGQPDLNKADQPDSQQTQEENYQPIEELRGIRGHDP